MCSLALALLCATTGNPCENEKRAATLYKSMLDSLGEDVDDWFEEDAKTFVVRLVEKHLAQGPRGTRFL